MDGRRADEGRQERWKYGRRTLYDAVKTLTGRYINGRRTVKKLSVDAIRSADGKIFTTC